MIGGVVMKIDPEIVAKAMAGDQEAFTGLYQNCYKDLYKFALYTLGNAEDAADAVSDTFLEVWKGLPKLRQPEAFPQWVFRILSVRCKREIAGIIQKRNTYNIDDWIEMPSDETGALDETVSEATSLAMALSKLEAEERMVIVLSVLHGYTNKEIAKMLGKPQGTVSSKIHRTYVKLRGMLGGEDHAG